MNINEPWEAQIDWAPDFPRGSHVFDSHGNEIATNVDGFQATLIAAAPDLLAVLLQVASIASCAPNDNPDIAGQEFTKIMRIARNAIAKAKGE